MRLCSVHGGRHAYAPAEHYDQSKSLQHTLTVGLHGTSGIVQAAFTFSVVIRVLQPRL